MVGLIADLTVFGLAIIGRIAGVDDWTIDCVLDDWLVGRPAMIGPVFLTCRVPTVHFSRTILGSHGPEMGGNEGFWGCN